MRDALMIEDATAGDLVATAQIIAADAGGSVDEWAARFAEVLADPDRHFLVAVMDGVVVGFGQSRHVVPVPEGTLPERPGGWYLSGVTVAPEHRRLGVGRELVKARLSRLGNVAVYYATEPSNVPTIRLHEPFGFVRMGEVQLPGRLGEPLALFRRELGAN